jgi:hypothetical protein
MAENSKRCLGDCVKKHWNKGKKVERFEVFPRRVIATGAPGRKVVLGKLKFTDTRAKKVAVREFNPRALGMSSLEFNRMIEIFQNAGIRIPKTGVIEHNEKHYQVMELFARAGKSKFLGNADAYGRFHNMQMPQHQHLIERIAVDYAKIINCGYIAKWIDVENYFEKSNTGSETYYFIDLQGIIKQNPQTIADHMGHLYEDMTKVVQAGAREHFVNTFRTTLQKKHQAVWDSVLREYAIGQRRPESGAWN